MARKARMRSRSQVYHILLRGTEKQDIFIEDEDKRKMLQILKEKKRDKAFFIYAYCILNNHIHLVIREGSDNISRILKKAATSYASYFNKKYSRSGHVFQDRFKSETVDDDQSLHAVIRFVHQNPEKAGIAYMDHYIWSSHPEYVQRRQEGLADCGMVLALISGHRASALAEFIKYSRSEAAEEFLDLLEEKEIGSENIKEHIQKYLKANTLTIDDLKRPESRKVRDSMIIYLINGSNLSRRNIAEILGINRETVRIASLSGNHENTTPREVFCEPGFAGRQLLKNGQ